METCTILKEVACANRFQNGEARLLRVEDQNEGRRLEHFAFFIVTMWLVSAKKSLVCAFAKGFAVGDEKEVRE